jgi:DNA-damage-inducible protein D
MENKSLAIFQGQQVRRVWHEDDWWFVLEDVIIALTDSKDSKQYIQKMKQRDDLLNEGWVQFVHTLSIDTAGGKQKLNCSNTEGLFRIIQSIPSKKAEPFKLWLAKVGSERINEIQDPELAIDRAMKNYLALGYSEKWINQRLKTIEMRKELTDEWKRSGVEEGQEFAILTNEMTMAWSGKSIREYKNFKSLKKENLRDNMTNLELALNMLAEVTTTEFSKKDNPDGLSESLDVAKRGGTIAGNTRKEIEGQLGEGIISSRSAKNVIGLSDGSFKIEMKEIKKSEDFE